MLFFLLLLFGSCSTSIEMKQELNKINRYEFYSEQDSLKKWERLKIVEIGKEITFSQKVKAVKVGFTDVNGNKEPLLLVCSGDCTPIPCGTKPWRYGCFPTDKCIRKEFKLVSYGIEPADYWLYSSFLKQDHNFIKENL